MYDLLASEMAISQLEQRFQYGSSQPYSLYIKLGCTTMHF